MDLSEIREQIDTIDAKLVPLIEQRLNLVVKVAEFKERSGNSVLDQGREQQVLTRVAQSTSNSKLIPIVKKSFQALMDVSKEYQQELMIKKDD